jgi:hypothetical protein
MRQESVNSAERRDFSADKATREREIPECGRLSLTWSEHPRQEIHDGAALGAIRNACRDHQPGERRDGIRACPGCVDNGNFEIDAGLHGVSGSGASTVNEGVSYSPTACGFRAALV